MYEVVFAIGTDSEKQRHDFLDQLRGFLKLQPSSLQLTDPEVLEPAFSNFEPSVEQRNVAAASYNWVLKCNIAPSTAHE